MRRYSGIILSLVVGMLSLTSNVIGEDTVTTGPTSQSAATAAATVDLNAAGFPTKVNTFTTAQLQVGTASGTYLTVDPVTGMMGTSTTQAQAANITITCKVAPDASGANGQYTFAVASTNPALVTDATKGTDGNGYLWVRNLSGLKALSDPLWKWAKFEASPRDIGYGAQVMPIVANGTFKIKVGINLSDPNQQSYLVLGTSAPAKFYAYTMSDSGVFGSMQQSDATTFVITTVAAAQQSAAKAQQDAATTAAANLAAATTDFGKIDAILQGQPTPHVYLKAGSLGYLVKNTDGSLGVSASATKFTPAASIIIKRLVTTKPADSSNLYVLSVILATDGASSDLQMPQSGGDAAHSLLTFNTTYNAADAASVAATVFTVEIDSNSSGATGAVRFKNSGGLYLALDANGVARIFAPDSKGAYTVPVTQSAATTFTVEFVLNSQLNTGDIAAILAQYKTLCDNPANTIAQLAAVLNEFGLYYTSNFDPNKWNTKTITDTMTYLKKKAMLANVTINDPVTLAASGDVFTSDSTVAISFPFTAADGKTSTRYLHVDWFGALGMKIPMKEVSLFNPLTHFIVELDSNKNVGLKFRVYNIDTTKTTPVITSSDAVLMKQADGSLAFQSGTTPYYFGAIVQGSNTDGSKTFKFQDPSTGKYMIIGSDSMITFGDVAMGTIFSKSSVTDGNKAFNRARLWSGVGNLAQEITEYSTAFAEAKNDATSLAWLINKTGGTYASSNNDHFMKLQDLSAAVMQPGNDAAFAQFNKMIDIIKAYPAVVGNTELQAQIQSLRALSAFDQSLTVFTENAAADYVKYNDEVTQNNLKSSSWIESVMASTLKSARAIAPTIVLDTAKQAKLQAAYTSALTAPNAFDPAIAAYINSQLNSQFYTVSVSQFTSDFGALLTQLNTLTPGGAGTADDVNQMLAKALRLYNATSDVASSITGATTKGWQATYDAVKGNIRNAFATQGSPTITWYVQNILNKLSAGAPAAPATPTGLGAGLGTQSGLTLGGGLGGFVFGGGPVSGGALSQPAAGTAIVQPAGAGAVGGD